MKTFTPGLKVIKIFLIREIKILYDGNLTENDLEISQSLSTRKINLELELEIEKIWKQTLKIANEKKYPIYNGNSYRLNKISKNGSKVNLDFGKISFKDRSSICQIPEIFELEDEYQHKGCFAGATVKTSDNKYILVKLSGKSLNPNKTDLLGGIIEDPIPLKNGEDLFQHLYVELNEEAGILKEEISNCILKTIYLSGNGSVGFYFEASISINSKNLKERFIKHNKDIDISDLIFLNREKYIDTLKNHPTKSKKFTAKILKI